MKLYRYIKLYEQIPVNAELYEDGKWIPYYDVTDKQAGKDFNLMFSKSEIRSLV